MAYNITIPKCIVYGENALEKSFEHIKTLGKKALIVTDKIMLDIGSVSKLTKLLENNLISYTLYSEVNSEPTDLIVNSGVEKYKNEKCDFIIGLGGGSPIDAAKAIGTMAVNPGSINDYMGKLIDKPLPNIVAIPTTAGTGSEATQFTIISNTKENIKMLLKGKALMPTLAIVDPEFTITSPQKVTAATGIDALTHAIEAYTSKCSNPLADTFALSAVKRIFNNLRRVYKNSNDFEARNEMSIGALEAGIAFNNSSVTIIHGMSRPIGALFHVPHGVSNAMLIVRCLNFAIKGEEKRFANISRAIGICETETPDIDCANKLVEEIDKLCKDIDIPTLEKFGVDAEKFFQNIDKMAEDALISGSPLNTRREPSKEDIIKIYKELWE